MSPTAKKGAPPRADDRAPDGEPVHAFATAGVWAVWLKQRHAQSRGVWIRFFKKDSGVASVTHAQALDEALCWGWIDGPLRPWDDKSWIRRFTPRRPKSAWSKRNCEHAARLTQSGRMRAAGLAEVAAAKTDGRWGRAYDPPSTLTLPGDFLEAVARDAKADAFFRTLNRANLYAIYYRLQTAKRPETRVRRFDLILAMLKEGRKFH